MSFRHVAALTIVGWYLMVPLRENNSAKLRDVPLAEWVHIDSFDTASQCRDEAYLEEKRHENDPLRASQYAGWECIASDDPRLKDR
jgi:hypothetical protein